MKFIVSIAAVAAVISACGADVTGKKFREEKHNRYEAELELGDAQRVNEILRELVSNTVQSSSLQWVFVNSKIGVPIDTYEKALKLCADVGFDLPTKAQLQGEGMTVRGIKNISGNLDLPPERMVYVKDEVPANAQFPVCVREIPSN